MRLALERVPRTPSGTYVSEVVAPRTNAAAITPAENLFGALSLDEPFALEIAATATTRRFLVRTGGPRLQRRVEEQVGVAYPQAAIRPLDDPDPAVIAAHERVAACTFTLSAAAYLPIRTFLDVEVDAARALQADPVLGILGALGALPDGWRALSQLVLRAAPDTWCRDYLRLAVDHPLAEERQAARGNADTSLVPVVLLGGLMLAIAAGVQAWGWWQDGDWLRVSLLGGGGLMALVVGLAILRPLRDKAMYDPRLVQEKVSRLAYHAELRLAIIAPASVPCAELERAVRTAAAAYRQFGLAAGNGLLPQPVRADRLDLRSLKPIGRDTPVLNVRELAGLWHLPQGAADVLFLERTSARRWLPLPRQLVGVCRIGSSTHQGHRVPVALPERLLQRHALLVAKTRRGKSSLLLRIAQHIMAEGIDGQRAGLVLGDPQGDLALATLGLVPPHRQPDVVYLDLGQRRRPVGLNFIDVGLCPYRDRAVAVTLLTVRRHFEGFWGPRMEDAFRFALLTLYEANETLCNVDPRHGRTHQYTLLDVPAVLAMPAFRQKAMERVRDPLVHAWWTHYFDVLDRRQQLDIITPVLSKVNHYAGTEAARLLVGQPASTINPAEWVARGAIVIINGAKGRVDEQTTALLGGGVLNLIALAIGAQDSLPPAQRKRVAVLADEFHLFPDVDYEALLSELAKDGASLLLATQSLARLKALDPDRRRALFDLVLSNIDGLFAFHTSAADAHDLVDELGGGIEVQDLVELGDFECYARLGVGGKRLAPFSIQLDRPPVPDDETARRLAAESALAHGRDRRVVEGHIGKAVERLDRIRKGLAESGTGEPKADGDGAAGGDLWGRGHGRSEYRQERSATPAAGDPPDADGREEPR